MLDTLLYWLARLLVGVLQVLPLGLVAHVGRWGGAVAYHLDGRHRRVALENLRQCFGGEWTGEEIREVARENFRRLGENYCSAIKTAAMSDEEMEGRIATAGLERLRARIREEPVSSVLFAIGHFGNFELYARAGRHLPGFRFGTTYRGLRQKGLDRLLKRLRERSGCLFFERRTEGGALRAALSAQRLTLGLLVDQHAGGRGIQVPFFGRECSTSPAPALLALRYRLPLFTAYCFRTAIGRWRFEVGEEIATRVDGQSRPIEDIMTDVNRSFEAAIRRDPANWFWVHKRWKPLRPAAEKREAPAPSDRVEDPSHG
jgi:KDO2-lipid IV(A) lauroyltransferase